MGQYVTLEMSYTLFVQILDYLRGCAEHLEGYYEIEDLVHTIDILEELYDEDRSKQNKEFQREREYAEIFKDNSVEEYKLGMVVVDEMNTLIGYDPFDSIEFQFKNAMRVIDAIKREYNIERKPPK